MKKLTSLLTLTVLVGGYAAAHAQYSIAPLMTFGTDGWLAPGAGGYTFLGTGNLERGLAYGNGQLYLVSRAGGPNIRRLDPLTGVDLGSPLSTAGISGGTFVVNMVGVGSDGAIYVNNLAAPASDASPYKIYRWANDADTPALAYSGVPLAGARVGDSFAVTGGGANTRIASGFGSNPAVAGNNSYAITDPTAGTSTAVAFPGTPPLGGDFRLGLTFMADNQVFGGLGVSNDPVGTIGRFTSFDGASGTLIGSPSLEGSTAQRLFDFTVLNGVPLLATQSIGDSTVRVFDLSDPLNPVLILSGNTTTGALTGNGNGTGAMAWGATTANPDGSVTAALYGMSSNQGIQAFLVTIPEPASMSIFALGLAALLMGRRQRV